MLLSGRLYRCRHPLGYTSRWVEEDTELTTISILGFDLNERSKPRKCVLLSAISTVEALSDSIFQVSFLASDIRPIQWKSDSPGEALLWVRAIKEAIGQEPKQSLQTQPSADWLMEIKNLIDVNRDLCAFTDDQVKTMGILCIKNLIKNLDKMRLLQICKIFTFLKIS